MSQFKLDLIREIKNRLVQKSDGTWCLPNNYFKEFEHDIPMFFGDWYEAKCFVINQVLKEN